MSLVDQRVYQATGPIEPVCEPGQNVLVRDRGIFKLYQVSAIETLHPSGPLTIDNTAMAQSGITRNFNPFATLDMGYGQMGQYRFQVLDDIMVDVFHPQASGRYTNNNGQSNIGWYSRFFDPHDAFSEFFVLEQDHPFFTITNRRSVAIDQARIVFYGYRYMLVGKSVDVPAGRASSSGIRIVPLQTFSSIEAAIEATKGPQGIRFTVIQLGGWTT